ncbi:hypothetical protein [Sodalis-like endosymbiont of Proechinophthirus fluctus]|uniref:hypothetical protein n=1 Tax=Sodalis-like endosymbiont of Proechinophthirus fluctus TaxID=1462730 RepID=UPI001FCBC352|nr:hypothetical protein [Sodalis-like endosymbiont of Proechinophthirus fluctus]
MTSLAFVFGVLPMASSRGGSRLCQPACGGYRVVIGGMLTTFLAICFYHAILRVDQAAFPADARGHNLAGSVDDRR